MLISKQYGLTYHLMAKSASSTLRTLMGDHFNATTTTFCTDKKKKKKNIVPESSLSTIHFTFVRDPLTRFLSGFSEFTERLMGKSSYYGKKDFRQYAGYLDTLLNHMYNDTLIKNCSVGIPNNKEQEARYKCLTQSEEGTKAYVEAFEQFVADYDAAHPFDVHVQMQVPSKEVMIRQSMGFSFYAALKMEDGIVNQIEDILYPKLMHGGQNYLFNNTSDTRMPKLNSLPRFRKNVSGNTTNLMDYDSCP
ncbi:MAG: hypothetical protein SGARI_003022 [Bacillariaceae sp.]